MIWDRGSGERSLTLCGFFVVFGLWRKRIDCGCLRWSVTVGSVCSRKVYGSTRGIYGRPPRNSWELSFWSRSRTTFIVNFVTTKACRPVGSRCHLMCLVYIRCLFCEASGTSSIECFVCDLHRFSIKPNGSVKHWKTWYAYFKCTTRMGYVPPSS